MSKIYSKKGDEGISSIRKGLKLSKSHIIFTAIGNIDELSSHIGLLIALLGAELEKKRYKTKYPIILMFLRRVQCRLQEINSIISSPHKKDTEITNINSFSIEHVNKMEQFIDSLNVPKLTKFILSGVYVLDANAHICRTITRRAERSLYNIIEKDEISMGVYVSGDIKSYNILLDKNILKYMNRLSDFFFRLARYLCYDNGFVDCCMSDYEY